MIKPSKTKNSLYLATLSLGLLLAGCASLSKKDCMSGDWHSIGMRDGISGKTQQYYFKHVEACGKHKVTPNKELYNKGRNEGLKSYCEPENGFRIGKNGNSYRNVCPKNMELAFLRRYQLGRELYDLEKRSKRIYDEIAELQRKMERERSSYRRSRIRDQINDLNIEKDRIQRRLTVLELKGSS